MGKLFEGALFGGVNAAVLTAMNGPAARLPSWWIASATSSFPVPDSPRMSTVRSLRSTRVIMR